MYVSLRAHDTLTLFRCSTHRRSALFYCTENPFSVQSSGNYRRGIGSELHGCWVAQVGAQVFPFIIIILLRTIFAHELIKSCVRRRSTAEPTLSAHTWRGYTRHFLRERVQANINAAAGCLVPRCSSFNIHVPATRAQLIGNLANEDIIPPPVGIKPLYSRRSRSTPRPRGLACVTRSTSDGRWN